MSIATMILGQSGTGKTAIKDALKRGIDIPGARLVQTQRLAVA